MPRQELSNVFQDGLMMDLNPINTPKSVLTDCLNGTYITYNGNEFVLQNDMGNYKLKNCKLSTNFIPVGVKGYGDILYIVSYNPITKETEIGSYPAPQSIFTTSNEENKVPSTDEELAPFNWPTEENQSDTRQYPELIKNDKKPLFIFAGSDEKTYKLNPGDEFKLEGLNDIIGLEYIYQHLNFYIIDEDNKLYDLDDSDMYFYNGEKWNGDTMRKVFWETPGWLAAQYDLYVPDKFNLNLKSLNVPEFLIINNDETSEQAEGEIDPKTQFEASMDLSSQVVITDLLFQNELNKTENVEGNHYKHLYIRYKIETTSGTFQGFTTDSDITVVDNGDGSYDIPCKWHNYQDDVITAFVNCSPVWWMDNPKDKDNPQNYDGVIAVTAYPIIKYNGKILEFTQFETKLRFPLNTLKNSNNITIADSIYKWSVDDDSCTISFNINGPFINASDITGRYEIYRINLFNTSSFPNETKEPDLDNPESYSSFSLGDNVIITKDEDGNPSSFEYIENNKNPKTKIIELNPAYFTSERKLLMCEGNLSNLVLYGQNTINIDWRNSNQYTLSNYKNIYTNPDFDSTQPVSEDNPGYVLDSNYLLDEQGNPTGSKTINFSKEGGIYIFRVILEQGEQKLAESKQVLIPSEVFNEWFGSIDNYLDETTGITSSMWIGKWLDYLTINVLCNNITVDFSRSISITPETEWDGFRLKQNNTEYTWKPTFNKGSIDWGKTIANDLKTATGNTYEWLSTPSNLSYVVNLNDLLNSIKIDGNISTNLLTGNLWNPKITGDLILKSNTSEDILYYDINTKEIILNKLLEFPWTVVNVNGTDTYKQIGEDIYPFQANTLFELNSIGNADYTGPQYNDDRGRALSWYLNGTRRFWDMGNKTKTDVNSSYFNIIGNVMTQNSVNWAYHTIQCTGRGNDWRTCLVQDSDENADEYGSIIISGWDSSTTKSGIQFFASLGSSTQSNKTVFLDFETSNNSMNRFMWALMHIVIKRNDSTISKIYFPTFNITDLIENNQYNITKYSTTLMLQLLRVDDEYLLNSNDTLKKINNNLFNDTIISTTKETFSDINTVLLKLNYTTNNLYNTFFRNITSGFDIFNETQLTNISDASKRSQGYSLQYTDTPCSVPSGFTSRFGSKPTGTDVENWTNSVIDLLSRRKTSSSYGKWNIGLNNDTRTYKFSNWNGRDNACDRTPAVMFSYYYYISIS